MLYNSFKRVADIYYENLIDYKSSKLYYDSALTNINRENKDYNSLKEKSDVLNELVNNLEIIEKNDSLIYLTSIPESDILKIIEINIKKRDKKQNETKIKSNNQNFLIDEPKIIITSENKGSWYFNNPTMVSSGRSEFISKWGNRELTDNWRLSSKMSFSTLDESDREEKQKAN